jgi:hypothetical protein
VGRRGKFHRSNDFYLSSLHVEEEGRGGNPKAPILFNAEYYLEIKKFGQNNHRDHPQGGQIRGTVFSMLRPLITILPSVAKMM